MKSIKEITALLSVIAFILALFVGIYFYYVEGWRPKSIKFEGGPLAIELEPPPTAAASSPTKEIYLSPDSYDNLQNVDPSISNIDFCTPDNFSGEKCIISQTTFAEGIPQIYVSWMYIGKLPATYSRKWYFNGEILEGLTRPSIPWGEDGQESYTFIKYDPGLGKGSYTLRFYRNDNQQLIKEANFYVQ